MHILLIRNIFQMNLSRNKTPLPCYTDIYFSLVPDEIITTGMLQIIIFTLSCTI